MKKLKRWVQMSTKFWPSPAGMTTVEAVSTLSKLSAVQEVELYVEHLRVPSPAHGALLMAVRVAEPLQFWAAPGTFDLSDD
jgi:hypothetical protein